MALSPGTKFGPFEIVAPLGAGGMGEVCRAHDTRLQRMVAIKILSAHLSANPEARERFHREARTISSLNHPNICHLQGGKFCGPPLPGSRSHLDGPHRRARRCGDDLGWKWFLLPARSAVCGHRVRGELRGENLDGDAALQPRIAGLVDFTHATCA